MCVFELYIVQKNAQIGSICFNRISQPRFLKFVLAPSFTLIQRKEDFGCTETIKALLLLRYSDNYISSIRKDSRKKTEKKCIVWVVFWRGLNSMLSCASQGPTFISNGTTTFNSKALNLLKVFKSLKICMYNVWYHLLLTWKWCKWKQGRFGGKLDSRNIKIHPLQFCKLMKFRLLLYWNAIIVVPWNLDFTS